MNARERVLAALNHQEPDRVPIDFAGTGVTTFATNLTTNYVGTWGTSTLAIGHEDLGGAAWAGVVTRTRIYDRLHSDVADGRYGLRPPGS